MNLLVRRSSACARRSAALSAFLDGELDSAAAVELRRHLEDCGACEQRLRELRSLGLSLRQCSPPPPPPQLGLRLRVVASHIAVRPPRLEYFRLRMRMLIEALALPMAVGTCAALVLFGFLVGAAQPRQSNPNAPDVTVADATPPTLLGVPDYDIGAPVLVDAQIDAAGRVYAYRLLSGPANQDVINRLNSQLLLAVFHPATTAFGQPTAGSLVVSFGHVEVRG